MADIFDYLIWRGDLDFDAAPFCEVDNLIFSLLAYVDFRHIAPERQEDALPLAQISDLYFQRHPWSKGKLGVLLPDQIQDLLLEAGDSRRFGSVRLWNHVNQIDSAREMQFSATTFSLGTGQTMAAFRGTDDTIVGWKEDFNMAVLFPVPAQQEAAIYLDRIAAATGDRIIVGGHSKGGNLAVYAAAFCTPQTRERIDSVWSNDGPGFFQEVLDSEPYRAVHSRIRTVLPRSSIVGTFLDNDSAIIPVESSTLGPLQHDGLTWQVLGPRFVRADAMSRSSRQADKTLHTLIEELEPDLRRQFIEIFFSVSAELKVQTLTELVSDGHKRQGLRVLYQKLSSFDKDTRDHFFRALLSTFREDESFLDRIIK